MSRQLNRSRLMLISEKNSQIHKTPKILKSTSTNKEQNIRVKLNPKKLNSAPIISNTIRSTNYKNDFKELPKISAKEYIGKEACTICFKEVKDSQQSISCNSCPRWTHRKCCKIKIKKFKRLAKLKSFDWYCVNCREDDNLFDDHSSPVNFEIHDLPDKYEIVMKTKNELLIIHLNCRSIVRKEEELQNIIEMLDPDIICLSETWLDISVPSNSHIPENYKMIRKDRTENFQQKYKKKNGGGVAILYKSKLNLNIKKTLNDDTEDILWAEVKMKKSFLVGVLYRPSYSKMLDDTDGPSTLEKNIRKATEITNQLIITGDFNIDLRDEENNLTTSLKDTYETFSLKQIVKKPTRVNPGTGKASLIDHIWVSPEINIKSTGTFIGLSDHFGTYTKIPKSFINFEPTPIIKSRNFKNYIKENFAEDIKERLANSNIHSLIKENKLNAATETLIDIIRETASIHAPFKYRKKRKKRKVPWSTTELQNNIKKKNELLFDYHATRNPSLKKKASDDQNKITIMKRKLKKDYTLKGLEEAGTDPAKLWQMYNLLMGTHKPAEDTEPECMSQDKANKYNNFFCQVGQKTIEKPKDYKIPEALHNENSAPNFSFEFETIANTEKYIDLLNEKTATGSDEINAKLIKDIKKEISPILTDLLNLGYEKSMFPDCLKSAIIKPIYKNDNKNDIANYRPIAILTALSKIFERSAQIQLTSHFEGNNLITIFQHAYRKGHGTITCLAESLNHIYKEIDSNKYAAIVTLDLSKAFDCLDHKLLLHKLKKLGLTEPTLLWMKSYLENRNQVTKFKNFISSTGITNTGVPQGSILGPLLFICFTNDLPENLSEICKVNAYADDTQLIITAKSTQELKEKIESAIEMAQSWFRNNLMKINSDKTNILIFNTSPETKNIKIKIKHNEHIIEKKSEPFVEILGIYIDQDLNWKKQINRIKRNAMGKIRNLSRIYHLLPLKHRINLYSAIVSPMFDYGDVLWSGCSQKLRNSLQRIQNFAIKSILGKKRRYSTRKCFKQLKLLTLEQRREIHLTVFAHKALLNQSSKNLHIQISALKSKFNTRNSSKYKLMIPSHRTAKFTRSPLFKMVMAWNNTPEDLPKENIRLHKIHYQKFLINETYPE